MKVAHVTLYPPKGEKHVSSSGVASYSKNLVSQLAEQHDDQVIVCNVIEKPEMYVEGGVEVQRVFWRRPDFIFKVHQALKKANPDVVHIQQELALFGGATTAYLLQWLVFLWRKKTVITLHGVVDPAAINTQFVRENNSRLPAWLVRIAFRTIYTPLMKRASRVIVHEQHFKNIAVKSYGIEPGKISVIPHGIEELETTATVKARQNLGIANNQRVALFMGYATGYKGIDLLIEGFSEYAKTDEKAYLIIGAGKHPKLRNDEIYLAEYARLQAKAAELISPNQYRWEGFIEEREIQTYYSASDVSLYPYTTALSSSGPMSFAIGYEKPFLVSTAFTNVFGQYEQLLFEKSPAALAARLSYFFAHLNDYDTISRRLKNERTWAKVSSQTLKVYNDQHDSKGAYEAEKSPTAG